MSNASPAFQPIKENLAFVKDDVIAAYIRTLFGNHVWTDSQFINIRGIGEKGTSQEGVFRDNVFIQPSLEGIDRIAESCRRWAQYHVASFVVPCVLKSKSGKADQVELFTNVLCDLDTGNTDEKLKWLEDAVGSPSMVIASGGTTAAGTPKRHVYYCLEEATPDIQEIVKLRDIIAHKVGGDPTMGLGVDSNPFGRAHQPVRIAGTCHAKNGQAKICTFEHLGRSYSFGKVSSGVSKMQFAPWVSPEMQAQSRAKVDSIDPNNLFSPLSGRPAEADLMSPVYEGGVDKTRWSEFNRAAGHYIRQWREGKISEDEALNATLGWVTASMIPPWPDHRTQSEFRALIAKDLGSNGPRLDPKPIEIASPVLNIPAQPLFTPPAPAIGLHAWAAHRWAVNPKPKHDFLVKNLILMGEPHIFVAEGGAGKTYLVEDLAMKIAAYEPGDKMQWCGQDIVSGGSVCLLLCEDSQTETHIRLLEIDNGTGLIQKAGDRLIVLPMTAVGGSFPLAHRDKGGISTSTPKWNHFIEQLKSIKDLRMVAIDTLNSVSHGDENNASMIAEMMREAHRVCGELGAALLVNHHIRKGEDGIRNLEELKNNVRGSSAISSYFRVCFGMFHAGDYARRMKMMGLPAQKNMLWRFGIAKCNINGLMKGERSLLRSKHGLLEDVTSKDKFNVFNLPEQSAWLIFAIKEAAIAGHPYMAGGKNAKGGVYKRRSELPPTLRKTSDFEFNSLIEDALQTEKISHCAIKGGKAKSYYDVPDGPLATDTLGAEISSGSYVPDLDWDEYGYNEIERCIMHKRYIHDPFPMGQVVSQLEQ